MLAEKNNNNMLLPVCGCRADAQACALLSAAPGGGEDRNAFRVRGHTVMRTRTAVTLATGAAEGSQAFMYFKIKAKPSIMQSFL